MNRFKSYWEIKHNWQLIFPILGGISLLFSGYKISYFFTKSFNIFFTLIIGFFISFILLKFVLIIFKKLESRWKVNYKWEMISIFIVFAITGSSSMLIGRPIIKIIGITKENFNPIAYWLLFIFFGIIFYQIMLVIFGWLFGQFNFFWEFEKKMLRRFGLGRFLN